MYIPFADNLNASCQFVLRKIMGPLRAGVYGQWDGYTASSIEFNDCCALQIKAKQKRLKTVVKAFETFLDWSRCGKYNGYDAADSGLLKRRNYVIYCQKLRFTCNSLVVNFCYIIF